MDATLFTISLPFSGLRLTIFEQPVFVRQLLIGPSSPSSDLILGADACASAYNDWLILKTGPVPPDRDVYLEFVATWECFSVKCFVG